MQALLRNNPILPVVTLTAADQALAIVDALSAGGINMVEITLRSEFGLAGIKEISRARASFIVGAGSVKTCALFQSAVESGAQFCVAPGSSDTLLAEAARWDTPFLPAAATPSEVMRLAEAGYTVQKLFPADALGGIDYLRSLAGPLAEIQFCPSGGIHADNFSSYLALANVSGISGSWLTPTTAIESGQFLRITELAKVALATAAKDSP